MTEATVPVDLRNPGQVFACLGLVEAAEVLLRAPCESRFNYTGLQTRATFTMRSAGECNPIGAVLDFLRRAEVATIVPSNSKLSTRKWDVEDVHGDPFVSSGPVPKTPATLSVRLLAGGAQVVLDSWADGPHSARDNVKFWAGSGGYPGSALTRDVLELIAAFPDDRVDALVYDPFAFTAPMSSSFRFDWRRDYIPLDAGFSPNKHDGITMVGYPLTEILALIGLQHARPSRFKASDKPKSSPKLNYRYGVSAALLPTSLARVVLGAVDIGFPFRTFHMLLGWPGKEGQARCIVGVREEF